MVVLPRIKLLVDYSSAMSKLCPLASEPICIVLYCLLDAIIHLFALSFLLSIVLQFRFHIIFPKQNYLSLTTGL